MRGNLGVKTMKVSVIATIAVAAASLLAGCAEQQFGGSNLTTASVSAPAAKSDPACASLSSQISALRSEGVADKVEKAAAKKYKMSTADLAKADQLNKSNADYVAKCSGQPAQQTAAADPATAAATSAAGTVGQAATQAATAKASAAASATAAKAATSAAGAVAKP